MNEKFNSKQALSGITLDDLLAKAESILDRIEKSANDGTLGPDSAARLQNSVDILKSFANKPILNISDEEMARLSVSKNSDVGIQIISDIVLNSKNDTFFRSNLVPNKVKGTDKIEFFLFTEKELKENIHNLEAAVKNKEPILTANSNKNPIADSYINYIGIFQPSMIAEIFDKLNFTTAASLSAVVFAANRLIEAVRKGENIGKLMAELPLSMSEPLYSVLKTSRIDLHNPDLVRPTSEYAKNTILVLEKLSKMCSDLYKSTKIRY